MFSSIIDLSKIDIHNLFDELYAIFERDFIINKTYLNGNIYIDPQSHKKEDKKEITFWHLTSRTNKNLGDRYPDFRRSERIEWIKKIIENHKTSEIKVFFYQESNMNIRLYLWAFNHDFTVIMQKLGKSSSFLVTSFYIDYKGKKDDFEKRYNNYLNNIDNIQDKAWLD